MRRLEIIHVAGARPNFVKVAPLMRAMAAHADVFSQRLVHTGQHYDAGMSEVFFAQLELPEPDVHLEVGPGPSGVQIARIMERFATLVSQARPDWVVVVGDVSSTLAAALAGAQAGIPVAHVEAGLRSFDRSMPEEVNRVLTDQIAELLFTPSADADQNLRREGIPDHRIHRVGNVMIDTLLWLSPRADAALASFARAQAERLQPLGLDGDGEQPFVLVTLHRPRNVDHTATLREIMAALCQLAERLPVVFPVHPRTRSQLRDAGFDGSARPPQLLIIEPLPYLEFIALERRAAVVLTDSGGVQEETTVLGVPCLTVRPSTERPVTLSQGTNRLVRPQQQAIVAAVEDSLRAPRERSDVPELWDGRTAERIVDVFLAAG